MFNATAEQLNTIRSMIESASKAHGRWLANLHRVLACGLPPSEADLTTDAHHRCDFGQWLYSRANTKLRELPSFIELADLHEAVHDTTRHILRKLKASGRAYEGDYDLLVDEIDRFREALSGFDAKIAHMLQMIDPLTGALNRTQLMTALNQAQQTCTDRPYTLIRIEMDIKEVNRQYGYEAGDRLLRACVERICEVLAGQGRIYRYAGAEFVISCPDMAKQDAGELLRSLLPEIGEAAQQEIPEFKHDLKIYQGMVSLMPESQLETLLNQQCALEPYTCAINQASSATA